MQVAVIISACCPDSTTFHFHWASMGLENYSFKETANGLKRYPAATNDFRDSSYAVEVWLFGEQIARSNHTFIGAAYALTCGDTYRTDDEVKGIRIYCINDYDSAHPANADITDYFHVADASFPSVVPRKGNGTFHSPGAKTYFYLQRKPTLGSLHRFVVVATLNNNRRVRDTTDDLILR